MAAKNPYDVLGIAPGASAEAIRSSYVKRMKVLHPDRFDATAQPVEWQMANDMLRELNEAYSELRAKTQDSSQNGHSSPSQPAHESPSSDAGSTTVDVNKSQHFWNEAGAIFLKSEQTPIAVLEKNNLDLHLAELKRYVGVNFESQMGIALLDKSFVDPLVIEGIGMLSATLTGYSKLVTERTTLLSRATFLQNKYPFWKTIWNGWQSMGISAEENQADQAEINSINPRLNQLGAEFTSVERGIREQMSVVCIKLTAKYGDRFLI
jgi:DnaJ domain